ELTGHWKDELVMLEKDLTNLEKQLEAGKTTQPLKPTASYKPATDDNSKYFTVSHQPVLTATVGKPINITVKVSAPAGIKWVRLQFRNVNQYLDYTMLPLKPTGVKDTYQVTIPVDKFDLKWNLQYLIEMMDNKNRGFIYPDLNKQTPYIITSLIR
ncbi:MAG: hypothetical protein JJE22_07650, partial [Bacteroidia bacterium]|nr:hypothetical protein [Bacteroidia bacterium]